MVLVVQVVADVIHLRFQGTKVILRAPQDVTQALQGLNGLCLQDLNNTNVSLEFITIIVPLLTQGVQVELNLVKLGGDGVKGDRRLNVRGGLSRGDSDGCY